MNKDRRNPELPAGRREVEGKLHNIISRMEDVIVELDRDGTVLFVSHARPGQASSDGVGSNFCDEAPRQNHATMRAALEQVFTTGRSSWYETQFQGADGAPRWIESRLSPIVRNDQVERVILISTDITHRKALELEAERQSALISLFYNLPLIGMSITDPESRRWLKVNDKLCEMMGYEREDMLSMGWEALTHPDDLAMSQREFERIRSGATDSYQIEKRFVHRSGAVIHTTVDVHCARNTPGGNDLFVGLIKDITARKQQEARIHHMAHHDLLTDLPNRTLLADRLRQTLLQAKRNQTRFAILFIDLDKFKPVNDHYGHAIGDLLLKAVAHRLLGCVRASDTVARMGGDEFVVLLATVEDNKDALHVGRKIHDALTVPFKLYNGKEASISSSIGVSMYPEHGDSEADLLRSADDAMYVAKAQGRDCVRMSHTG